CAMSLESMNPCMPVPPVSRKLSDGRAHVGRPRCCACRFGRRSVASLRMGGSNMNRGKSLGMGRRAAMTLAAGAGVAAAIRPRRAKAADVTLSAWTGYPELVPWYQACGEAYAKTNPGFKLNVLSTTLREHEQKLAAAMPTGTGPDLFDV